METRTFGSLGPVSVLTLGGGGLGQVWGETTRDEAVATARAAVDAGITLLDVAPMYGRGEAEAVIGEAFAGRLPDGVRVGTKVMLGDPEGPASERIERSLTRSLATMRLDRVDLLWLHSNLVPDDYVFPRFPEAQTRLGTPWRRYVEEVRPAFEALVADGRVGAWGITGVALPRTVRAAIADDPAPAAVQCIANLLDSTGAIYVHDEPLSPRETIAAARHARVRGARHPGGAGRRAHRRDGPRAGARRR